MFRKVCYIALYKVHKMFYTNARGSISVHYVSLGKMRYMFVMSLFSFLLIISFLCLCKVRKQMKFEIKFMVHYTLSLVVHN